MYMYEEATRKVSKIDTLPCCGANAIEIISP